jgi:hypothetical protein
MAHQKTGEQILEIHTLKRMLAVADSALDRALDVIQEQAAEGDHFADHDPEPGAPTNRMAHRINEARFRVAAAMLAVRDAIDGWRPDHGHRLADCTDHSTPQ